MNEILMKRAEGVTAFRQEKKRQIFKAYYLVIADIFDTNDAIPTELQTKAASRLRTQIELIR
jgi:hypothetical protein